MGLGFGKTIAGTIGSCHWGDTPQSRPEWIDKGVNAKMMRKMVDGKDEERLWTDGGKEENGHERNEEEETRDLKDRVR